MLHLLPAIALFLLTARVECNQVCKEKMESVSLVPKYANFGTPGNLSIVYSKEGLKFPVQCGNELPLPVAEQPPVVTYDVKGKCKKNVTMIMFDPDIPILLKGPFLHWFVMNISPNQLKKGYSSNGGTILASYFSPGAPLGNHRYTTCVYCQLCPVAKSKQYNLLTRFSKDPRKLAKKFRLGNPLACNFFYLGAVAAGNDLEKLSLFKGLGDVNRKLGNHQQLGIVG